MKENDATQKVTAWLADFGAALAKRDVAAAAELFADDCYWRDLVAFTWNLQTAEGKDAVRSMLQATVPQARPGEWRIDGEGAEADGVADGWFTFETTRACTRPRRDGRARSASSSARTIRPTTSAPTCGSTAPT